MKLSELVKQLQDLNYEYFHTHRVNGNVPDEPEVYIPSFTGGFIKNFILEMDDRGIIMYERIVE
jgi:hypothetical protein